MYNLIKDIVFQFMTEIFQLFFFQLKLNEL